MAERGHEKSRKRHRKDLIWTILMVIAASVMLFSGYQLFQIYSEYREGEEQYEEIASIAHQLKENAFKDTSKPSGSQDEDKTGEDETGEVGTSEAPTGEEGTTEAPTEEAPVEEPFDPAAYARWFADLHAINPDIAGWITIEGTNIDYPVMYGETNDEYIYHTYNKTYNGAGSIFMEAQNSPDFGDYHTVLYGHNMKNGSMFAGLHRYADASYYREHPTILIDTPSGPRTYAIFSCHTINAYDDLYDVAYTSDADYQALVQRLKSLSAYETGVSATGQDHVLTLSTCKGDGDMRFVVHAVWVQE